MTPEEILKGEAVLGSAYLTAGIPGEGELTLEAIETWLAEPTHHAPLKVVLPAALAEDAGDVAIPADNPLTLAKIELGRQLFFDKRLSGIGTFACATCHRPEQRYTSHHVMPEVGRNASTTFNRILGDRHFWDGRAASLEAQPESPIRNAFEMNSTPAKSTAHIQAIPGYRMQFEKIFGEVSFSAICQALASFQRALVTTGSAWDDGTLDEAARRGETLFFSERTGCSACHSGRNLTDEDFHHLAVPGTGEDDDAPGYFATSGEPHHRGAFKTPSLRNVAETPPYMHNGVFGTLDEVIEFFDRGGGPGNQVLRPLELSADEKQDLLAFLQALTGPLPPVETARLPP